MKKLIATTLSGAVLLASVAPAVAQDYRYASGFAPQQDEVTATVNYRVPLGVTRERPSYGLTINASRADDARDLADGVSFRPQASLADIRFNDDGLYRARLGAVDFAQPNALSFDDSKDPKDGKDPKTWWIIGAIVVGGIIWWAVEEDDDDDDDNGSSS